ncbi:GTP-binding protein TypA [Peptococcaceae bacterium SCADC1_2_3]|jgi:GTP-binding protein|nr:GTP-binding protein TypA [Peptococcaceae bacterium SCADC1_2_3]KFI35699.1 GTP-binding protein TypA [Peptococcaceae bacterium SCADC1_2_3]KFI36985.1 GTP-binding protein TypA [Peptococcaceae bacterium SCADC1_2_3]KFI37541.1 GTP-binding protein TypA [Peptococcaceae bacterium SCADC1_2_3]
MEKKSLRNIAIIAHVDHGKTTLVDKLLRQSGYFRNNQVMLERVMDSNELERERGITILSKNTSIIYKNTKINIVDTPGHADFGGEVERIVKMVDGVLLLVDAFEGSMPQTRFVLKKSLEACLKPIVVINKIDRPGARPEEVLDKVLDLFIDLEADEEQLDFPVVYTSAKEGFAKTCLDEFSMDMKPLLDMIIEKMPAPEGDPDGPLQLVISSIDYDNYVGRIGVGKIGRGVISTDQEVILCNTAGKEKRVKINTLYTFEGLKKAETLKAIAGEIIAVSGIEDINIGDTLCSPELVEPVPFVNIDEPTISMNFIVNDSPMAGLEGTYVTSRNLRDRLERELLSNVSLRVKELNPDCFKVSGRGELHLSILIESMRREGYEFAVTRPEVILKKFNGVVNEPIERLFIEVSGDFIGTVIEGVGKRKGELLDMNNNTGNTVKLEFLIPARGLIGYRSEFLTDTRGNGIMNHIYECYQPFKGEITTRTRGSLVASESGIAVPYGLYNAQGRGNLFLDPGVEVYAGMVVGENARNEDITVNVCKKKHLTNTRASGSDDALRLTPPVIMTLEKCLEFINDDELLEVTPKSLRLRKMILKKNERDRSLKIKNQAS